MIRKEGMNVVNRSIAGQLLSRKLEQYVNTDAIVVGVPRGGVVVASAVAETLGLVLHVLPCRKILHPADNTKAIGSVCLDEVVLSDNCPDIPSDYVSHQIALLRSSLRGEIAAYNDYLTRVSLRYKTLIVVDDILMSGATLLACLRNLIKQLPLKLIVAVPYVSASGARLVQQVADDLLFIRMDREIVNANKYYRDLSAIKVEDVTNILRMSRQVTEML